MSEIREILKQIYQSGYEDGVNAKYGIRTKAYLVPVKEKEIIKKVLDEIDGCGTQWICVHCDNRDEFISKQELKQRIKEWEWTNNLKSIWKQTC